MRILYLNKAWAETVTVKDEKQEHEAWKSTRYSACGLTQQKLKNDTNNTESLNNVTYGA